MAKLKPKIRTRLLNVAARTLGVTDPSQLDPEIQRKLIKRMKNKGQSGVLKFINKQRVAQGMDKLAPRKQFGDNFNLRNIAQSRNLIEKTAYKGAKTTAENLSTFDESGVKNEVTQELQPFYDEQTQEQTQQNFDWTNQDNTTNNENRKANAAFTTQGYDTQQSDLITDYRKNQLRSAEDKANQQQQFDWQKGDQIRAQNNSFAQRGVTSTSPALQRLRAQLNERQQFSQNSMDQGFQRGSEDLTTGYNRGTEGITQARKAFNLGQDQSQAQYDTTQGRNDILKNRYARDRKRQFAQDVGTEVDAERQRYLNPSSSSY